MKTSVLNTKILQKHLRSQAPSNKSCEGTTKQEEEKKEEEEEKVVAVVIIGGPMKK